MNKYEELLSEKKKIEKNNTIVGIILAISITTLIFCITSFFNAILGTITIILTTILIIILRANNKRLEEIEIDIHDIEIIKAGNEEANKNK